MNLFKSGICPGWIFFLFLLMVAGTRADTVPPLDVADDYDLAIPQGAFGHDYLFSASLIPQKWAATSSGLAGRIVQFAVYADSVDMYESTQGLVVTEDLPARRLLATFPIVRRDNRQVVVDFNKGMSQVFTEGWTDGGVAGLYDHETTLEIPESRVFDVQKQGQDLVIRQSVQARSRENDQDLEEQFEIRYFITPYLPGHFNGKEPGKVDARYVRFFETEGEIEPGTGRVSTRIARFDLTHPIPFYYSANTPADYEQAVRDGILYWNSVFGSNVITAAKAPEGVTAPDARYNLVQWVPWDHAGFAYADILLDPLTGESKHGQVYLTSAFAFFSKSETRSLLREFQDAATPPKSTGLATVNLSVPFLKSAECCDETPGAFAAEMANGLNEMLATPGLDDASTLRASQDYVREVVAHEVGHILGLRHNFAGSLGATLSSQALDQWFKDYVAGKPLDSHTNDIATTSVMDYNIFKAAVFTGWQIRTEHKPLPYDREAIAWGYKNEVDEQTNHILFATDEDIGTYGDVRAFDYGRDPLVTSYSEQARLLNLLPNFLIERFISARAPQNPNDRIPLEQVDLHPESAAMSLTMTEEDELKWFDAGTRSLRVESAFSYIGDMNRDARLKAHWKYLNQQVEELGGVDRAFFSSLPPSFSLDQGPAPTNIDLIPRLEITNLEDRLNQLLKEPQYLQFTGLDDKIHHFTPEDTTLISARGREFFTTLQKEWIKDFCQLLAKTRRDLGVEAAMAGSVNEDDITAQLEKRIIAVAGMIITAQDSNRFVNGKEDAASVQVPVYTYDTVTRMAAVAMLADSAGSYAGWADDAKADLNKQLRKQVEDALNLDHFKDFSVHMLSRPLRDWYQQQLAILAQLPAAPGGPPALPAK